MGSARKITIASLSHLLRCPEQEIPEDCLERFNSINTCYRLARKSDVEHYVLEILGRMEAPGIRRERDENFKAWETGWGESLESLNQNFDEEHLKPKYFRNSKFFRFRSGILLPENPYLERDLFALVRNLFFHKYFRGFDTAYELGCGSCQNVYALAQLFPKMTIHAWDWAEPSRHIAEVVNRNVEAQVKAMRFDMFEPQMDVEVRPNSIMFTIHALEQLHTGYSKLISFFMAKKPALVFHYEPILEFYDDSNLYDYLARVYSEKRNYLSGYLSTLRELERAGKIRILEQFRPFIGGVYHEASVIVWQPIHEL
jgi:hypothetical protein